ncbi:hypothetical protein J5Y04_00080 [Kitasatospora sp. RG8]|uniref:hypothetical protein n=1 Tax=Kitasatospora sp. RG8 TaxID=2820815 RepID=UPI001ADF5349|nr:hypothetical protein [Kitasatospora sp. RG8]MBP0447949.1 hypothetical protein [Kitasatospora sp. RG8]
MRRADGGGTAQPQWNASSTPVASFAAQSRPVQTPALGLKDAAAPTGRVGG